MGTQKDLVTKIVVELKANPHILDYARNFGNAIVPGPANHCAVTLSALLIFAGIYPVKIGQGYKNIEEWAPTLANDLQQLGWQKINVGQQIVAGDVGVVLAGETHHIYLVIDATDQAKPLVADNRFTSFYARPISGDPGRDISPTNFFLRAPTA